MKKLIFVLLISSCLFGEMLHGAKVIGKFDHLKVYEFTFKLHTYLVVKSVSTEAPTMLHAAHCFCKQPRKNSEAADMTTEEETETEYTSIYGW